MGPYVEQGLGQSKSVALQDGSKCQSITSRRSPGSATEANHSGIIQGARHNKRTSLRTMVMYGGILVPLLLTTLCVTTWAFTAAESANITETDLLSEDTSSSVEDEDTLESRNDLDDLSDDVLRSFFDFTSTEGDNDENTSAQSGPSPNFAKPYSKHYPHYATYSNGKSGYYAKKPYPVYYHTHPSSYHRPLPPLSKGQVTPGSHYKFGTHKPIGDKMFDESKQYLNSTQIVGPYQVSVVDANSPLLSSLGLKRHHLEKLAGSPIPVSTFSSSDQLTVSGSVPSATYAEHPRHQYNDHGPHQKPPYDPGYDHSRSPHPPPQGAVPPPNYHHPAHHNQQSQQSQQPQQYQHNPSAHQPPQRSYIPPHQTYKEQYSSPVNTQRYHHNSPQNAYPTQYSSDNNNWRPSSDGYEKEHDRSKDNPNYNRGAWQQPSAMYPPHPPPLSQSYSSTYAKPSSTYASPSSKPSSSSYPKYESSTYNKPSYSASSSSIKAPERAGSASYDNYHSHQASPPSKPSITVRFKAKAPHAGISIPLNFNPLEVVKKLAMPLASLNPLANKKVTIGITIENKNQHSESYHPHSHYR